MMNKLAFGSNTVKFKIAMGINIMTISYRKTEEKGNVL